MQKLALNVASRGHSGFVSPFAFLLVSQMQHYTHNSSVAHTLGASDFFPLGQECGYILMNSYSRCISRGEDRLQLENVLLI